MPNRKSFLKTLEPEILPLSSYYDVSVEKIQDYGEGKHLPVALGAVLGGRYRVVHKLEFSSSSLSYVCRDTHLKHWRRVTTTLACQHDVANSLLKEFKRRRALALEKWADIWGVIRARFDVTSASGTHACMVYPLYVRDGSFRVSAGDGNREIDEECFLEEHN